MRIATTVDLCIVLNIILDLEKNDVVTPENKLFAWRLLAAIVSIDSYVTLKNKDQYQ